MLAKLPYTVWPNKSHHLHLTKQIPHCMDDYLLAATAAMSSYSFFRQPCWKTHPRSLEQSNHRHQAKKKKKGWLKKKLKLDRDLSSALLKSGRIPWNKYGRKKTLDERRSLKCFVKQKVMWTDESRLTLFQIKWPIMPGVSWRSLCGQHCVGWGLEDMSFICLTRTKLGDAASRFYAPLETDREKLSKRWVPLNQD